MKYAELANAAVPQSEALEPRQVRNNAGGFVFAVDDWARLDRFLVLGSDAPTYYQNARQLTRKNAACVERCYALDPARTVARIAEISQSGRAPKNDAAIFALALGAVAPDDRTRALSLAALSSVCRTGTHLFDFVTCARALGRGWGRGLKRAVARWYDAKPADTLAYQVVKYRQRARYTHKRLLQTARPHASANKPLYGWIKGKEADAEALPALLRAHLAAMQASPASADGTRLLCELVHQFRLPWEALPTWALTRAPVWGAMVPTLGLTALIRNLGNMSRHGAIVPLDETERLIVARLGDAAALRRARVHPFAILQAMAVYGSGRGFRGAGTWSVSQPLMDALDRAFYTAFANVEPTGKRFFIGLDVSGSMSMSFGGSALTCAQVSAALSLVTLATEPRCFVGMFDDGIRPADISARMRLEQVVKKIADINAGGTDCSLPMLYALRHGIAADVFLVITDNETWAGKVHPATALRQYRAKTGIAAKLIVLGITATNFSIADPSDGGMLDVVGMDAAVPALIADFVRQ